MASPKSGTACQLVAPISPKAPEEADKADPGEVTNAQAQPAQAQAGQTGSVKAKPFKPEAAEEDSDKKKSWIELKLEDEKGQPVAGEPYEIKLPDGSVASGTTDAQGVARVEGFDPGQCEVTWPNLDKSVVKDK